MQGAQVEQAVIDPVQMDHIGLPVARQAFDGKANPTRAESAATIEAIGPQRQTIELLQQVEAPLPTPTRQNGSYGLGVGLRVGGEEVTVEALGQQTLVEPKGPPRRSATEITGSEMEHPHGASIR